MAYKLQEGFPLRAVYYAQFIKYERLNYLFGQYFQYHEQPKWINIYIDLYSMLTKLYLYKYTTDQNPYDIVSITCNMAIHYKEFFRQRGIGSFVFLLYSPTTGASTCKRFIPDYNKSYTSRMQRNPEVTKLINTDLYLIDTICHYLPNIYFKQSTVETAVMAYDMIKKFSNKGKRFPSLFITASQYAFQLPGNQNMENEECIMLFRRKTMQDGDLSYLVTKANALDYYIAEIKNQNVEQMPLKQSWVSGFMTLSGIPKRNIGAIFDYNKAIDILKRIEGQYDQVTPDSLYRVANEINHYPPDEKFYETLVNRYRCIDLDYQLYQYRTLPDANDIDFLKQFQDSGEVSELNRLYFGDNPINIEKLY